MGLMDDTDHQQDTKVGNQQISLGFGIGSKLNKYKRLDSDLKSQRFDDEDDGSHHHHQDKQDRASTTKQFVIACAIFASLNTVLIGYDVGVMSGAIIFMKEDLKINEVQEEILIGSLSIISLVGNLAGGKTADVVGRKWTMGISLLIFQTGITIMTLSNTFHVLMIGRLLSGIGMGIGGVIATVYIAEISPTVARGTLTSFPEIFINFGILLGYVSNYAFSSLSAHKSWRVMLAVGILPSVIIIIALFIIPESPRWLVMKNRVEEARSVLLRTNESEKEAEERLVDIQQAAEEADNERAVWHELLFPSPILRRMLVIGVGIQCFQQITGIDAIVYYSPEIFKVAGIENKTKLIGATVAVGLSKTAFILVAIFLIDKVGRKPLLYVSTIGMTFCLLCLGFSLKLMVAGPFAIMLALLFVCSNVAFFSVGIGPICWVLSSEIFPLRLRAQAVALGSIGGRVSSGLVSMSLLSLAKAISMGGTFLLFSAISALSVVFVYTLVPETKGKSLEQIVQIFEDENKLHDKQVEMGDVDHLVQKE